MNFKSQICTTREQSERLTALGLKKETADMTIHIKDDDGWYVTAEPFCEWEDDRNTFPSLEEPEPIVPAWSLHRLWELANLRHIILDSRDEIPILYDEVIAFIESQIKEGMFNKNYLE